MVEPQFKRIGGLYILENGDSAAVWMALDKIADVVHLYDACIFKNELPVVVAEGLNARGRWIPVAWEKGRKEYADQLLDRGCSMTYEPFEDNDQNAERVSREILERMRTGRFKAEKRLKAWIDEYSALYHDSSQIPRDSSPLMAATRIAMGRLDYAKRQAVPRTTTGNAPKVAII